jgi:hypothetical protein
MTSYASTIDEAFKWPSAHKLSERRIYKVNYRPKPMALSALQRRGLVVSPTVSNGRLYRCTIGGMSSASEPTWPTVLNETIVVGNATFVCIEDGSLLQQGDVIQSQTWSVIGSPVGITMDSLSINQFETKVRVNVASNALIGTIELVNAITVVWQNGDVEELKKSILIKIK